MKSSPRKTDCIITKAKPWKGLARMRVNPWKHSPCRQITGDREQESKKRSAVRAVAWPRASAGFDLSPSNLRLFSSPSSDYQSDRDRMRLQCFPVHLQRMVNPDPAMPCGWGKRKKVIQIMLCWFPDSCGNRWGRAVSFHLGGGKN